MSEVIIQQLSDFKNTLTFVGSVENVINGVIPEELKHRRFAAGKVKYGFELGSPQGIYNLGECIIINSLIYSSRTDFTRTSRDPLMWGPEFVTPGMFLVPKTSEPNFSLSYCSLDREFSFNTLYQMIYEKSGRPFAIAGCAELVNLRSMTITYSPIEKENIFSNQDKYFRERERNDKHVNIAFVGVVSDMGDSRLLDINTKLRSVLYYNPYNKQKDPSAQIEAGLLVSHTHAVTLARPIVLIPEIVPQDVKEVIHLMDDSTVRYVRAEVFTMEDLVPYVEE